MEGKTSMKITQAAMDDRLYTKGVRAGLYGSLPQSAIEDPALGAREIAVLGYFVASAAGKGKCFEKRSTSMALLNLSKLCYSKSLRILARENYISLKPIRSRDRWFDPAHEVELTQKTTKTGNRFAIARQTVMCSSLSATAKALYLALTCKADTSDQVDHPTAYLSSVLRISENTLSKYLKELVIFGLIERETQTRDASTRMFSKSKTIIKEIPTKITPLPCPPLSTEETPSQKSTRKKPTSKKRDSSYIKDLSFPKELPFGKKTIKECLSDNPQIPIDNQALINLREEVFSDHRSFCEKHPGCNIPAPTRDEVTELVHQKIAEACEINNQVQIPPFEKRWNLHAYLSSFVSCNEENEDNMDIAIVLRALEAVIMQKQNITMPNGTDLSPNEVREMTNRAILYFNAVNAPYTPHNIAGVTARGLRNLINEIIYAARKTAEAHEIKNPIAYCRAILLARVYDADRENMDQIAASQRENEIFSLCS